ncbi:protein NLRC5-like [Thalassophryne amazonica]|uniref:protein NLRC5-like n=1 Tax=Thalassophryne amazonica TaxID=390379 RepID=UPI00147161EE|nr:protein NLRC5-like [Thalassophryne amazonica]
MVEKNTLQLSLVKPTEMSSDSCDPSVATEKIGFVDCDVPKYLLSEMSDIIQGCFSLTELIFSHNHLDVEGADFFSSVLNLLPKLTTLSLSGLMISEGATQNVVRTFPRLQHLSLSSCEWTEAVGLKLIKELEQCVCLQGLCLASVRLSQDTMECFSRTLRNIKSLRRFRLNHVTLATGSGEAVCAQELLPALEELTLLEQLELDGWRISDVGLKQLIRLLPGWTNLKKISLSKNLISDHSGAELLEALRSCVLLEELHLSGNRLGNLTAARMAFVLPLLTCLTVLDISQNEIRNEGAVSLSKALSSMKNLTEIHLTAVGTSELCAVTASLVHSPRIQDVSLGWNSCGDAVALELARILPLFQRMSSIDLESNSVSVIGAEALVRALRSCPALHFIRLWRNKISFAEAQKLRLRDRRLNFSST